VNETDGVQPAPETVLMSFMRFYSNHQSHHAALECIKNENISPNVGVSTKVAYRTKLNI
jgi:hypothetical protein